jgi:hypothetical protein
MNKNLWRGCACNGALNPKCPVHSANADDSDGDKVFEYQCLIIGPDGTGKIELLSAVSTSHAFTEAWHEFDGRCVAVKRGEFLHN